MANRRMISKDIFYDDGFTDLDAETRLLYAYLILNADDDGMLTSTKQVMFLAGADKNDLQTLVSAGYLYEFPSGVYVIRHWYMMNKVQPTRKTGTIYQTEKSELKIINDVYCRQNVDKVSTQDSTVQYSIGKGSIGQDSTGKDSTGKGKEGKVILDDATSDNSDAEKVSNALNKHPELRKIIEVFKDKVAPLRDMDDFVLMCDLYEIYGKDALADAVVTTIKEGGQSVQYLAKVCKSQNAYD